MKEFMNTGREGGKERGRRGEGMREVLENNLVDYNKGYLVKGWDAEREDVPLFGHHVDLEQELFSLESTDAPCL